MPFWPRRNRKKNQRRPRPQRGRPPIDLELGLLRLEPRRVLTVNAMLAGAGDVLEVQLSGADESATITVNAADELEIRDSLGAPVLINGSPSINESAIQELRIQGDGASDQAVTINEIAGDDISLDDGLSIDGVDAVTLDAPIVTTGEVDIRATGDVTVADVVQLTNAQLTIESGDLAIASSGRLEGPLLNLRPQSGVSVGIGTASMGDWQLDTLELTEGIESNGLLRLGRVGGSEDVNIRLAHLSGESYDVEIHGGDISLGGDGVAPTPLYADNNLSLDGTFTQSGFMTFTANRCRFGSTAWTNGDSTGDSATFEFAGLEDGDYELSTAWCDVGNRSSAAPYAVSATGSADTTFLVSQRGGPDDFSDSEGEWERVGIVRVSGGMGAGIISITISDDAVGFIQADAVRIARAEPTTPSGPDLDVGGRSARLVASGPIVDLMDSNLESLDVVAGPLSLESNDGVGVGRVIETDVDQLGATAAIGGGVFIENTSHVTVDHVGNATGIVSAGPVDLTVRGDLVVAAPVETTLGSTIRITADGNVTLDDDIRGGLDGAGSVLISIVAGGDIEGGAGRIINRTGGLLMAANAIGASTTVNIGAAQVDAISASEISLHSDQSVAIGGALGLQANGAVFLESSDSITVDGNVSSGGAGILLVADSDIDVHAAIASDGGDIGLDAGDSVRFTANGLIDAGAATGSIEIFAGRNTSSGSIQMDAASAVLAGAAHVVAEASGDLLISRVVTANTSGDAIRLASLLGAVRDVDDGMAAAIATNGTVHLASALGIHLDGDPASSFLIDAPRLTVSQDGTNGLGTARILRQGDLQVDAAIATAADSIVLAAENLLTIAGPTNVQAGSLSLQSLNDAIVVESDTASITGDIALTAAAGITVSAAGSVTTNSGMVSISADNAGTLDGITMADGSQIDGGDGEIHLNANGDIAISNIVAAPTSSRVVATVVSTSGEILDGGDTAKELDVGLGRVLLDAALGIGAANALETQMRALAATTDSGDVTIDDMGPLLIESIAAPNSVVSIATTGSLGLDVFGIQAADAQLSTTSTMDLTGAIDASQGNISLLADDTIDIRSTSGLTATDDIVITVDPNSANAGSIRMEDFARITAGGNTIASAAGDIEVAHIAASAASDTAIQLNAGGAILDAGDQDLDLVGQGVQATAVNGIGVGNALETQWLAFQAMTTGNVAGVHIDNQNAASSNILGITATGDVDVRQFGSGLTLSAPIQTGDDGAISIQSQAELTVQTLVSTAADSTGAGAIDLRNVVLATGVDLRTGPQGITLEGGGPDSRITGDLNLSTDLTISASRNVIVASVIDGNGANLTLTADEFSTGLGGVWLQSEAQIHDVEQLALSGSDVVGTPETDGVRVDADTGGQPQIEVNQTLYQSTTSVLIDGHVRGNANANTTLDVVLGPNALIANGEVRWDAGRDIVMDGAAAILAGGDTVLLEANNNIWLGLVQTENTGLQALRVLAGGAIRDANGATVNLVSTAMTSPPTGDAVIDGAEIGEAADRIEVSVGTLRVNSTGSAFLESLDLLLLGQVTVADTFDVIGGGGLVVTPTGVSASTIDLDTSGPLTVNAPLNGDDIRLSGSSVTTNSELIAASSVVVSADLGTLNADVDAGGTFEVIAASDVLVASSSHIEAGAIVIQAGGVIETDGELSSSGDILLTADSTVAVRANVTSDTAVTMVGVGDLQIAGGSTIRGNFIQLSSEQSVELLGDIISSGAVQLDSTGAMDVAGNLSASGSLQAIAGGSLNVSVGSQVAAMQIDLGGADVEIAGALDADDELSVSSTGMLRLTADGSLTGSDTSLTSGDSIQVLGSVNAAGTLALQSQQTTTLSGPIGATRVVAQTGADLLTNGQVVVADAFTSQSAAFTMSGLGQINANSLDIAATADVTVSSAIGRSTQSDAIVIETTGAIMDAGATTSLSSPGGAQLTASQGIGGGGELTIDVASLALLNRVSGDVDVFDVNQLRVTSALQQAASGEDLTLIASDLLTIDDGITPSSADAVQAVSGRTNLISEFGTVDILAGVFGADRVVVTADDDVLLSSDASLRSDTGNVGVLADFSGSLNGGRILMADGSQATSGAGLVALRADGDVVLGHVASGRAGSAIRIESVNGQIVDGGDTHTDIEAFSGGVQIVADGGAGLGDPLDVVADALASDVEGGLHVNAIGDLRLATVGTVSGNQAGFDSTIDATGTLTVADAVNVTGNLALTAGSMVTTTGVIQVDGAAAEDSGNLRIQAPSIALLDAGATPATPELTTIGNGVLTIDATQQLDIQAGVEIVTSTGRFQSLPLIEGQNLSLELLTFGGDVPIDDNGLATAVVGVGVPGDANFLLDVNWSNGAQQIQPGTPGGETVFRELFADNQAVTVTVTFGLDPRPDGEGGFTEAVQLFERGVALRPTLTASRVSFGLGVDNVVLTFESEVEPVVQLPRPPELELLISASGRSELNSGAIVDQSSSSEESSQQERLLLRIVDDIAQMELPTEYELDLQDLTDLPGLVQRYQLPDGHYRIYFQEAGSAKLRLLLDLHVVNGKIVPENYRDGATERPPAQPERPPALEETGVQANPAAAPARTSHDADLRGAEVEQVADEPPSGRAITAMSLGCIVLGRQRRQRGASTKHSKASRIARRVRKRAAARNQAGVASQQESD